jgi:hypothetical protein
MWSKNVCVLLLSLVSSAALARTNTECTLEIASGYVILDASQTQALSASASLPILEELKSIVSKGKKPGAPLRDQLNARDLARFAEINTRLSSIRLSSYVESSRERDATVVQRMYDTAWKIYADPTFTPAADDFANATLYAMRIMIPKSDRNVGDTPLQGCSIEAALTADLQKSYSRINADTPSFERISSAMNALKASYGIAADGKFDRSKMKPGDLRELERFSTQLQPFFREADLVDDLQHILEWWQTANMIYSTRKQDIATYGASVEHMGKTLDAKLATAPDHMKLYVGLWNKVNEKVPSQAMKDNEILGGVAAEAAKR